MTTDSFQIVPQAVSETVGAIRSLVSQAGDVIGELESAVLDGTAFAGVGTDVAAANTTLQSNQVSSLRQLSQLLDQVNQHVDASNQGYQQADQAVATGYGDDTGATQLAQAAPAANQGTDMTTDQQLRDQLGVDEGNRTHVYTDTAGHPTVGIGFNLDRADARTQLSGVGADYDAVRAGTQDLSQDQINQLFSHDVGTAVGTARGYYAGFDQLDATRQRVLTNMAFNMGPATLGQFHQLHTALTNGDWNAAATAMQNSHWANQVGDRATRLIDHMRTGQ
ncbi:MAG TPA: glycoside hydrolase family protein [Actinocatenispora sp.]